MPKLNAFSRVKGWVQVICGPMFAGKSEELLRKLNRLKYADVDFVVFKPKIDTRSICEAKSRNGQSCKAIEIEHSTEIVEYLSNLSQEELPQVIAIDEAQFLDEKLHKVCDLLANKGFIVYVAGLDLDFRAEPFPTMMPIIAKAEKVIKLTAVCTECGAPATRSQRLINGEPASYDAPIVQVGNVESYCARCRHHHIVKNKPRKK